MTINPVNEGEDADLRSLSTEEAQIKLGSAEVSLSQYATSGSGTSSDPYVVDFADITSDADLDSQHIIKVDGYFHVDGTQTVPQSWWLKGGTGNESNDHGAVIEAASTISGPMVDYEGGDSLSENNWGGAVGVKFNAAYNADYAVRTNKPSRMKQFQMCSFRRANTAATHLDGRQAMFWACEWGDNDGTGAIGLDARNQQLNVVASRFATNYQDFNCYADTVTGAFSFRDCVFANHHNNPSAFVQQGGSTDFSAEASILFGGCDWVDFGAAVNGLKLGTNGDDIGTPVKVVNCNFDGANRSDGTATGNKAINVPADVSGRLQMANLTVKNFTNTPVVDVSNVSATNLIMNGTMEESGVTGSALSSQDAGMFHLDISTSPPTLRVVTQAGSLTTIQ